MSHGAEKWRMRCYGWAEAAKRDACVGSLRCYAVSQFRLGPIQLFVKPEADQWCADCSLIRLQIS